MLRKTATGIASDKRKAPVTIDMEVVRDALGRQKFFQESAARTAVPGVATGLAVSGVGGDVLFVEATTMKSQTTTGGLELTGQLGDVMKESAKIALSYVHAHATDFGIAEEAFENRLVHIHVPAGALPKDGPSAGVDDDHSARLAAHRPRGQAHRRDDRRDHAPGSRAADRGPQAEGARGARSGADRRDHARSATGGISTRFPRRSASRCASTR